MAYLLLLLLQLLLLPLLLCLVSGIIQFARIWEARFFTWLAAYNGARAAMVYNESEYFGTVVETNVVRRSLLPPAMLLTNGWKVVSAVRERRHSHLYRYVLVRERDQFYRDKGIVWLAAVNTLAWMSETEDYDSLFFPTMGHIPHSSRIKEQVEIVPERMTDRAGDYRFCLDRKSVV